MKNLKRRFFIKSSSLVAGGLVLPSFNINRMANSANNKKLKVSVVGCGGRGTGAAVQALRADENVELVAMADAFKDRLEKSLNAIKQEFEGEKKIEGGKTKGCEKGSTREGVGRDGRVACRGSRRKTEKKAYEKAITKIEDERGERGKTQSSSC